MLKAFKDARLFTSPDRVKTAHYASLEVWKYTGDTEATNGNFTVRRLDENLVADWAWERGSYSTAPGPSTTQRQLEGGIRLLFAEPRSTFRQNIPVDLVTGNVLEALDLPRCSFGSFQLTSGVFSVHTYPEGSTIDDCKKLGLIFRTPQQSECSTGGLSLCHDFSTGITRALIVGYSFSLEDFTSTPPPALNAFLQQLKDSWTFLTHPLLLPSAFLICHTLKVRVYVHDTLQRRVVLLEHCIGITKAGRSGKAQFDAPDHVSQEKAERLFHEDDKTGEQHMQRDRAKKLTTSINDLATRILFAKRSPRWDLKCSKFLLGLLAESNRLKACTNVSGKQFEQTLEYVESYSEALAETTDTFQARIQLQLDILYTVIAQDDGQTNARLAASAGKDSTSMKILALITAAYLPGTFVASFFSMGMFDWSIGSYGSVSKSFWIYWAVSIPLTVITLTCFGVWWKIEQARFERDVQHARTQQDTQSKRQGMMSKLKGSAEV